MENVEVESIFSRICRTCKCEEANMQSVFASSENPEENPRVDEMLMACASVQVNLGDGLPDLICSKCLEQLKVAYVFKQQCEKTDSNLREFAKINKDDIKPVITAPDAPDTDDHYLENLHDFLEQSNGEGEPNPVAKSPIVELREEPEPMPALPESFQDIEPKFAPNFDFIQFLDNNQMLLTCRECSKVFTTLEGLKCHKRIHSGALFKCRFCEKEYTRKNHLERHEATHGKRKVHVCRICNKTLTRFEHLKRHLATHLKEKPFACKICKRGFSRLEHLNNHAVRCKGDRMHICDICNKAFTRADSMEVHKKLHAVEKPVLPTLENLDNIEEHYYEIDFDKNMEFSDPSDGEDSMEAGEFRTGEEELEAKIPPSETSAADKEEEKSVAEPAAAAVEQTSAEPEESPDDNIEEVEEEEENGEVVEKAKEKSQEMDIVEDDKSQLEALKREIEEEDYEDNYIGDTGNYDDDDSDSNASEYVPPKVETPRTKRGRGRPRKNPLVAKTPGRKRGRPPTRHLKKEPDEEVTKVEIPCPAEGCDETFDNERKFEKHARKHVDLKLHVCDVCNKNFARANHLKRHMKSHSLDKPFCCDICKKSFNRKDHLTQHQKLHERQQEHTCEICQKSFYKLDQLAKHQASKHGIGERFLGLKKFECHICNKLFTTEKYRDIHVRGHTGEKQHECQTCSKVFLSKSHLTEHMKFHNENSKKFLCSECGQRFIRNDYLVIHMRRHRGEKPFKCKFCGKGFPRTTDLTVHERYHTGEKTHLCTICGRGFGRAYNLTVHMRTHTGEKPYQCTYCDAAFAQGNDLKAHVRRHTGERFHCELCPESFLMGYLLTQHKRNVHGLNVVSNIRRLNPIHKKEIDTNSEPPITVPLPKPVVSLMTFQTQLAAQLEHQLIDS